MPSSKPLVIANWKCNPKNLQEARRLFGAVKKAVAGVRNAQIVICPPFVYLPSLVEFLRRCVKIQLGGLIGLGAQDCFWQDSGAFTGEVSAAMLKDIGCEYVIVGHSERRHYFNDTDEIINKKLKAALKSGLKPILCLGESLEEREKGETSNVLKTQLENGLRAVARQKAQSIVLAYEPVWAVGTANPCLADEAMSAGIFLRRSLAELYDNSIAQKIPILYGGSVSGKNAASYIAGAGLQGLLVGGASLDDKEFLSIVRQAAETNK